jgi:hypothetical protein
MLTGGQVVGANTDLICPDDVETMVGRDDKARGFSLPSYHSVPLQPPYPLNQSKVLVDREYYYQIITTNNQPKALVDRVSYNLIISTNNHMKDV